MKLKMVVCLVLAAALMLTACGASPVTANSAAPSPSPAATPEGFSDVPADADYAEAVEWCRTNGIMNGVGEGRFDPEGTLSRAMLVTALYRGAGEPEVDGAPTFADTQTDAWYSDAVAWSCQQGIILGYGDGLFGTDDPISVEQLEVVIGRFVKNGVQWVGDPAKEHTATRAMAAVALYNALSTLDNAPSEGSKVLVAYFSATGTTEALAEYAAEILNADLFEIVPETPYTEADLAYYTDCRADREQNDPAARPAIADDCKVENMESYDAVVLGYPIWHGQAPRIISTFLESYDFEGKTILPFCTSGSSPMGSSATNLHPLASGAEWLDGERLASGTTREEMRQWLEKQNLTIGEESSMNKITLTFNGHTYTATLAENSSATAFAELLKDGPLTVSARDYGNFEKVGELGTTLPRNDRQITTSAGDIILYQGSQITVYYAENSWNFTLLGRLDDPTGLRDALGDGDVDITFTLGVGEN